MLAYDGVTLSVLNLTVLLAGVMGRVASDFYSIGFLGMFTTNIIGGRGWIAFDLLLRQSQDSSI